MQLRDLFSTTAEGSIKSMASTPVTEIVFDTRSLKPGCVFIAIRGTKYDGHQFLNEAVARGAVGLVVEDSGNVPSSFAGFVRVVGSSRIELARLAALWCDSPSKELFTVGVTGTNGKTTTTHMIESVLNSGGLPTGVVGTIDHHFGSRVWPTERTTPDPLTFQGRLREFVVLGARAVALEVTSHALDQARVDSVDYDVGIFTNLTRDHLDYHGTIEAYFEAKLRFFTELLSESAKSTTTAILNVDDPFGVRIASKLSGLPKPRIWTLGQKGVGQDQAGRTPTFRFSIESHGFGGAQIVLDSPAGSHRLQLAMAGLHNVQNAVSAFASGLAAGFDVDVVSRAIEEIRGVSGRLESVANQRDLHIFVDYAHTDDALIAILRLLKEIRRQAKERGERDGDARIITVFGCGGDRDRGKRPMMMRAALDGSDQVIVTSDNPRTEDPDVIIDDAMAAVEGTEASKVERTVDRRVGIARAIELARAGDVILIAGKGHETTQTIGTVKHPFSDVAVVKEILGGLA